MKQTSDNEHELDNSNHSKGSAGYSALDWSNHSDGARDRVLPKRYADAGKLNSRDRFQTESQTSFKSHKTTPSGRKIKL